MAAINFPNSPTLNQVYTEAGISWIWNGSVWNIQQATPTEYVPYNGAIGNVNLGEYGLSTGYLQFDTTPTTYTPAIGNMGWNEVEGTIELLLRGGVVNLPIGQKQVARIVNGTGTNVLRSNYQVVKVTGAQGQRLQVNLAQANNDANSADTLGLIAENINSNNTGFIITSGLLENIDTTGSLQSETWADGDVLYLSPTVAGRLTNIKPQAPDHTIIVGFVVYAHSNNGKIFVKVDNGYEIDELHNVRINTGTLSNGQVLKYNTSLSVWENASDTVGTGTVISVSVVSANGFAGTVATASSTPAITLSTTITGILKGNGTAISAAVANTDYQSPITLTTTGSSGASTFNGTTLNIPTYTLAGLGGFANPMTTLGDVIYGAASGVATRLGGNITTSKQYLSQTGTGTVSTAPVWASISGADVTGAALTKTDDTNVTLTLGGTPSTSLLRAASLTLGWTGTLAVSRGGTGASTLTGVLIGNGTSAVTAITGTANQLLRRNAGDTAYEFFTPSYLTAAITSLGGLTASTQTFANDTNVTITSATSTHTLGWTGQLAISRGGTGASTKTAAFDALSPMTTIGDIIYGGTSGTGTRLAGNTTTTKQYLSQTGTGTASAAPSWSAIAGADVTGAALTKTDDTNVTLTLGGTPSTSLLRAASLTLGWTGQLAVGRGGSGASTLTGVLIGNGTSAFTGVTGTAGQLLRRNAGNTAYEFFTPTYLTANETITLSGDVSGSGTTSIPVTIGASKVTNAMLVNSSFNIGTTSISLGRASAAQTLTGVSINGNAATVTNGVYTTGAQTIDGNKTFTGITTFSNSSDAQIYLVSPDSWAGIQFDDSNSDPDYIWYHGQNKTFAIGGGGSNVGGKKLHIHGGVTIGTALPTLAAPTNGLFIEGNLTVGNSTSSNIVMTDTDETTRTIHCNSGRIGFLNSSSSWGAYCDNSGYWSTPGLYITTSTNGGYFDGEGSWGVRFITSAGHIQFGPANTSHAHIYTDRPNFYFNKDILINGTQVVYASGTWGISISGNAATATSATSATTASSLTSQVYNISNEWFRDLNDDAQVKFYGNSRTMIYRTDGNTNAHGGGAYAHIFYYGGSADGNRVFIVNTDGRLYSPYHGWLDTMSISGNAGGINTTQPTIGYSISGQNIEYVGQGGPQVLSQGSGAAMMTFHRPGAYAINLGLGTDNQLRTGGWSRGGNYVILDSGNYTSYAMQGAGYSANQNLNTTSGPTFAGITSTGNINLNSNELRIGSTSSYHSIEVGVGRTGSGFAYIDLIGDTTYSDFGLRVMRGDGGANTYSLLEHRGTGNFIIETNDQAAIVFNTWGTTRAVVQSDGDFRPGADDLYKCGTPSFRWYEIYSARGTINTSDIRQKEEITESDLGLKFITELQPVSYKMKNDKFKDSEKIDLSKHYGLIAQQVKEVLGDREFAGYVYDEKYDSYGLRYTEFIAPLIKSVQELKKEVDSLKAEIVRLNSN